MAGSIISNFMMFLPKQTQWFCLIVMCIAVFGIWIPYEEHKKKKKQRQKYQQKNPEPTKHAAEDRQKLEQLKSLKDAGILSEEEYQERKRELRQQ